MSLTSDEREWLHRIEDKLDKLAMNGCAMAAQHIKVDDDHERRLRSVESDRDVSKGWAAAIGACVAVAVTLVVGWIGKHL